MQTDRNGTLVRWWVHDCAALAAEACPSTEVDVDGVWCVVKLGSVSCL